MPLSGKINFIPIVVIVFLFLYANQQFSNSRIQMTEHRFKVISEKMDRLLETRELEDNIVLGKEKMSNQSTDDIHLVEDDISNEVYKTSDGFFDPKEANVSFLAYVADPIPAHVIEFVNNLEDPHEPVSCEITGEQHHFVYIKVHKCASDTLATMFRRFTMVRNLSAALPVAHKCCLGWPWTFESEYVRYSKTDHYDTLFDHSIYNEEAMKAMMPDDSVYMASLRNPFSHLKSAMAYMMIRQWSGIEEGPAEGLEIFLRNIKYYDDIYKSPNNSLRGFSCVPKGISMARNSMVVDLAFPTGFHFGNVSDKSDDWEYIKQWMKAVTKQFQIVIISDHFFESLIMVKRMMCWSLKDIVFSSMNVWKTKYKDSYDQVLIDNYKRFAAVDHLAFQYFNRTLWERIEKWGTEDFMDEVAHYKEVNENILEFCKNPESDEVFTVESSVWDSSFEFTPDDCFLIKHHLRDVIRDHYDNVLEGDVGKRSPKLVPGC